MAANSDDSRLLRSIGSACPPPLRSVLLEAELALAPHLDSDWALRPLFIDSRAGDRCLWIDDPAAEPLDSLWCALPSLAERLQIAVGIANAVGRMHSKGIVHRNLKPQNVFVGASRTVWLTGFGLATIGSSKASPDFVSGTMPYISPEQTGRLDLPIDPRSDIYSVGIILYELFVGRLPFHAGDALGWIHCHIAEAPPTPAYSPDCPEQIGHILARLLRKLPEERYQTAAGLEADLRACQHALTRTGVVTEFPVAERDSPYKLSRPADLYGRRAATLELEASWQRVCVSHSTELLLVSGPSGIGKSALLKRFGSIALKDGVAAYGKCDALSQATPYGVLAQAMAGIVNRALSLAPSGAEAWRDRLRQALGANGKLMEAMMPGLERLLGPQPGTVDLPPLEAKNRFELLFGNLLEAAASVDGPLLLMLDDLQWVDLPSMALLKRLLSGKHVPNMFLVGSYRNGEASRDHDLQQWAHAISGEGVRTTDLRLQPLDVFGLREWLTDAVALEPMAATTLADVTFRKTGGIPLAVTRFLGSVNDAGLITYSDATGMWTADAVAAQELAFTENLLSVMVTAVSHLPPRTRRALQRLACLGGRYSADELSQIWEADVASLSVDLQPAVTEGLVVMRRDEIRFIHDRIREAAYSLIEESELAGIHLTLARSLARLDQQRLVFETARHYNAARSEAVEDQAERDRIADLNLRAARRSMEAMGHAAALNYLAHGRTFLGTQPSPTQLEVEFAFSMCEAESRMLTGDHEGAERLLGALFEKTTDLLALATVCKLQADLFTMMGRFDQAVAVGMEYLRRTGLECPREPSVDDVVAEARELERVLAGRAVEALAELPMTVDRIHAATLELVTFTLPAVLYTSRNLHSLLVLRMAVRTLQCGRTHESGIAFIMLSRVLGPRLLNHDVAYRFGRLGYRLTEAEGADAMKPIGRLCYAVFCCSWTSPLGESAAILQGAIEAARLCGNQTYTAYAHNNLFANHIVAGTWIGEALRVADDGLAFSRASKFLLGEMILRVQRGLAKALRGETAALTTLLESEAAEHTLCAEITAVAGFELPLGWYWIRKLQACVIAGDAGASMNAREHASPLVWASEEFLEEAEFHLFAGLAVSLAARAGNLAMPAAADILEGHLLKLQAWSRTCPSTFACRAELLAAERASLTGHDGLAQRLYEQALLSARRGAYANMQALIAEAAYRHHLQARLHTAASAYLAVAQEAYAQWGATAKAESLNAKLIPTAVPRGAERGIVQTSWRSMDLSSVLRASQALSQEIKFNDVTRTLLCLVLEQAGGDRALLLLCREGAFVLSAEARKGAGAIVVETDGQEGAAAFPESVGLYVRRTREALVLNDPHRGSDLFSQDSYVQRHRPRSVVTVPLLKQNALIGLLYVENTFVPDVFTPSAVAMLDLLAPQVAISLENARLYADLVAEVEERHRAEAALRANEAILTLGQTISQTGSWRWNVATGRAAWSAQLYAIMGMDPSGAEPQADDVLLRIHPDERAEILAAHSKAVADGTDFTFEYRVVLADGTTKHLLAIGQPDPLSAGAEYVGVVMDVSERRRVDEALRETQVNLAHAGRLTTMGQLTASIAHEVNQPLAAMVANGSACVRWLDPERTNLERARETARRIVADGHRAATIIESVRSMARNAAPAREDVDLNAALRDVVILLGAEARKRRVRMDTLLTPSLPPVSGDRTQLQQVFVNLAMNGIEALESQEGERRLLVRTAAQSDGHLVVSFEDNGPGIDAAAARNVFQPFFTTKSNGMGMGLAICQSIATAHGGTLTLEATERGGTVFQLRLAANVSLNQDVAEQTT